MKFLNTEHKSFFESCVKKADAHRDTYRQSLFYILGLTDDTRNYIDDLYDFNERGIRIEGQNAPWQTDTTGKVTRLAFNLYNGFAGDSRDIRSYSPEDFSPYHLFDTGLAVYFIEGIKLRYPEYFLHECG